MKKIVLTLFIISLLVTGCTKSVKESDKMISNSKDNYIIVDVRTKEEYDSEHIEGAINIPYDTIGENTKLDKAKTIMVYCKSGVRSNKAYVAFKALNYDVIDLGSYENAKKSLDNME